MSFFKNKSPISSGERAWQSAIDELLRFAQVSLVMPGERLTKPFEILEFLETRKSTRANSFARMLPLVVASKTFTVKATRSSTYSSCSRTLPNRLSRTVRTESFRFAQFGPVRKALVGSRGSQQHVVASEQFFEN